MGEKTIKALLALLRELDHRSVERWQQQARILDKLYAPTCYSDAHGDALPADVCGPEDAIAAFAAATALLGWAYRSTPRRRQPQARLMLPLPPSGGWLSGVGERLACR